MTVFNRIRITLYSPNTMNVQEFILVKFVAEAYQHLPKFHSTTDTMMIEPQLQASLSCSVYMNPYQNRAVMRYYAYELMCQVSLRLGQKWLRNWQQNFQVLKGMTEHSKLQICHNKTVLPSYPCPFSPLHPTQHPLCHLWWCVQTILAWPLTWAWWGASPPTTSLSSSGPSSQTLLWVSPHEVSVCACLPAEPEKSTTMVKSGITVDRVIGLDLLEVCIGANAVTVHA